MLALAAARADGAELWVDGAGAACSDARTAAQAGSPATPWCTVGRAAREAGAGDTVRVRAGTYRESVRPARSGTPAAPIRFAAEPGAVIEAAGTNAIKLIGVSDVAFDGFEVRGGTAQGIWVDGCTRISLQRLRVVAGGGAGIQLKASADVRVEDSAIVGNGGAGIMELAGTRDGRYLRNVVTGNGRGGGAFNGDGIQLGGSGALIAGSTIAGNGDDGPYEHGVYSAPGSRDWTIESSELRGNGAANVKAAGGPGTVRANLLDGGRFGLVLSDNPAMVTVERNEIRGSAQHLVFLTAGATAARGRLVSNTIVQTGRSTAAGDASAVFVNAAAALELRDNAIAYANPDALGVALWVNDAARLTAFSSDDNSFCATDPRGRALAWNGSRTTLAAWREVSGQDLLSTAAAPADCPQSEPSAILARRCPRSSSTTSPTRTRAATCSSRRSRSACPRAATPRSSAPTASARARC
ncbi:right-handed parallel beta-helix repeat-containing protein [Conexibacter woesei]|uniref:Parallel beta-helix repeat protein n=1 Tax=Conexibacter woesei (strain DSM 14684 / CCUG 47730 / CIP 108061 / JCM 11494 / NBRC 100937 / ID131577) TaxID=469383 RepID=D3F777_CONWI|nr:right-handed parallel beta-helix repeat-containing protein [Conexibacter woesei]ADB48848.1 Parallel beta-helix repeat protein [Conexibacter woesei DSM 14684]